VEAEKSNKARDEAETYKSTKSLMEEYDELSKKLVKTTEEQERWNELIGEINEQFPEIITSYDEANGKITLQRDLW